MTLTAITSVVALASMPIVVQVALRVFLGDQDAIELSIVRLVRGVFVITTVPVAAGMLLRAWRPALVDRWQAMLGRVATTLFVLIVIATFVEPARGAARQPVERRTGRGEPQPGRDAVGDRARFRLSAGSTDAIAIASECGLQNAALGIFIATSILGAAPLAVPSVVYALLMNVGAFGLIYGARRWIAADAMRPQPRRRSARARRAKKNCSQYLSPSALFRVMTSCCHFPVMPQPSPR